MTYLYSQRQEQTENRATLYGRPQVLTHLTGDGNYTWLHSETGKKEIKAKTLKAYSQTLPGFIRIHKSILVNPEFISQLEAPARVGEAGSVILQNGVQLSISRRRWAPVLKQLMATETIQ
jgi:DNA-binding LytR/AlgR family response regulator